jgi:hypothetical protein
MRKPVVCWVAGSSPAAEFVRPPNVHVGGFTINLVHVIHVEIVVRKDVIERNRD